MSMAVDRTLSAEIEAVIRSIPGVTAIFRTGSTVSKVIGAGAPLLGLPGDDASLVRVEKTQQATRVELAIGVLSSVAAVETVHRAHAAIDAIVAQRSMTPADIRITVVHVDEKPRTRERRSDEPQTDQPRRGTRR